MDPLTIGGIGMTLSTLTGLVALWKGEQRERDKATLDQFIEWLRRHNHEQVVNLIQDNAELTRSLRGLVEGQHEQVMDGLASLDRMMTDIAGRLATFGPIVQAMRIESQLSEQAISILRSMNEAKASAVYELTTAGAGWELLFYDGVKSDPVRITEPRLAKDDLRLLVANKLLTREIAPTNEPLYRITRAGAKFGAQARYES